ncbi:hypothetical protein [Dyella silvatica]|nr:hypothetical protein [Dyella silvatica]
MAKKRTVRPYYTKAMQRLEQVARQEPNIKHAQAALEVIEDVRRERMSA